MTFKRLFSKSLGADPDRLHLAAHSHHLWPDASFDGQVACWNDAARLADGKWDRVMGEVWPRAQAEVGNEIGGVPASRIVFAANTHDFIIRLAAACPRRDRDGPLRILTTDGEFHSARRQFSRWQESGEIELTVVDVDPVDTLVERTVDAFDDHDMIFVSQMLFGSGRLVTPLDPLVGLADPDRTWVVVDGYHSFMAIDRPFPASHADRAFFLGGGYKYAMAGEGMGFMSCPPGFGKRPPLTGWFAEFDDLSLPPGIVGYAPDAMRFMGATFDASALYRFNAVCEMLAAEALTTAKISKHVADLQRTLVDALDGTVFAKARLLNPPAEKIGARFLAFQHPDAAKWCDALKAKNCITDVRGSVLRLGLGLYHDERDIAAFADSAREL